MDKSDKPYKQLLAELNNAQAKISELERNKKCIEETFRLLETDTEKYLNFAGILIVTLDEYANITMIGGRSQEILGYKSEELIGQNWFTLCVPGEEVENLKKAYARLMNGEVDNLEYHESNVLTRGGETRCMSWHNSLLKDGNGQVIGTLSSGIDITEQKQVELALRESERKYRQLFENMSSGFALHEIICDSEGKPVNYKYLELNPAFEKLTGVPVSALLGKTIKEVLPDTEDYWITTFGKVALTGEPVAYENYSRELGRYYDTWVFSPEQNQFAVIFSDITERKRAEAVLREGDRYFRALFNQSSFGVAKVDSRTGTILKINQRYCSMVGYTQDELLEKKIGTIVFKEDLQYEHSNMERLRTGDITKFQLEKRYKHKNGSIVWVNLSVLPLWSPHEQPDYHLAIVEDITERKFAEETLQRQKTEQQQIINNMVDGVISIDQHGRVLTFSTSAESMFGYKASEIIGGNIKTLMSEDFARLHENHLSNYLKTNQSRIIGNPTEVSGRRKSGEEFPMRLSVAELPVDQDGTRRFIGSCHDLTLHKQQEEQLRRSQKMDALGKLTGGIAHDYNNMMGVIKGYTNLLEEVLAHDSEKLMLVNEISRACDRGSQLSRKLLAFSRYKKPHAEPIDINELLQAEHDLLQKTLTPRIQLELNLFSDIWAVKIDSGDFEDAILNLSINAMHAMESGGKLTISTTNCELKDNSQAANARLSPGEYVVINIKDTGTGMDAETLSKVFDPFFTTKGDDGVGLGLSMVYGFARRSGGDVSVSTKLGSGSEFSIYIPRFKRAESSEKPKEDSVEEKLMGSDTILVVDDEPALVFLARKILENKGYRVLTAKNGTQALEVLENNKVDMLISDVIMPGIDGFQLAMQVMEKYPDVKIQLMSGYAENKIPVSVNLELEKSIIRKPFGSKELLQQVRSVLDRDKKTESTANTEKHGKTVVMIMDDDQSAVELFDINLKKLGYDTVIARDGEQAASQYKLAIEQEKPIDVVIMDLNIPGGIDGREAARRILALNPHANLIVASGDTYGNVMANYEQYGFKAMLEKTFDRREMQRVLNRVLS